MILCMSISKSIAHSAAVSTVVYLRNRTFSRAVGLSGDVSITLFTSTAPDAYKFRVFGCIIFAKVPDILRQKLGEKALQGVMVGYPSHASWYRVDNLVMRRIRSESGTDSYT
jgi:uncharacterized membrane protein